ncbi:hypothetical protein ACQKOH_03260 [Sphingomonas sp. NPDC092331]|jgi:hypothetical protein|uniref:hypothetical protein n=1 Tax=unclassified Sphingomonas TaxID=196159 RepID=UPI0031F520F5
MIGVALLAALQLGEAFQGGDELLAVSVPADGIALFRRVCLTPFPDAQAFEAAVAHDSERLARVDPAQVGMLDRDRNVRPAVGGVWRSARYNIRYMAAGAIAPTVPQPQCRLSIRLADPPEPARLAGEVASALKLADTHTLQVGLHIRHYWDLARPEGGRWRLMMKSETRKEGNFLALSLSKLKDS